MTKIQNTRELPRDMLRCFALTESQAQELATEYQSSWFYPATEKTGYLYVLDTEYQEKKQS